MGTSHFQAPTEQKPLDLLFRNFAQLITSARPLNLPKMVTVAWQGAAPHTGEIYACILCFTLPFFHYRSYRLNYLTNFYTQWLEQYGFAQGRAFLGSHSMKLAL
jgi:hypothetical protein